MTRKIACYGWHRDLPDSRDLLYVPAATTLPSSVDLRNSPFMPLVYDQGQIGSCTGNATAAALQFERRKQSLSPDFVPSRLFIYYNARVFSGDVGYDGGAQIRDAIKGVVTYGAPAETEWPYETVLVTTRPTDNVYSEGKQDVAIRYWRIPQTIQNIKTALAEGTPVVFGFTVYESFESTAVASTGVVPMPHGSEGVLGGHAVLAVGYDDSSQRFIVRNSWGPSWGLVGYFTMPYAYLDPVSSLAADFWRISRVGISGA